MIWYPYEMFRIEKSRNRKEVWKLTFSDFPNVPVYGNFHSDVRSRAAQLLEYCVRARIATERPVPRPGPGDHRIELPTDLALHLCVYWEAEAGCRDAKAFCQNLKPSRETLKRLRAQVSSNDASHNARLGLIEADQAAAGPYGGGGNLVFFAA